MLIYNRAKAQGENNMTLRDLSLAICSANEIEVRDVRGFFSITFKNDEEFWDYLKTANLIAEKEVMVIRLPNLHSNKVIILIS